jgi:hypothetical protein
MYHEVQPVRIGASVFLRIDAAYYVRLPVRQTDVSIRTGCTCILGGIGVWRVLSEPN